MEIKALWIAAIALIAGAAIGFLIANSINRSEIESLRAKVSQVQPEGENTTSKEPTLSDEEIRERIRRADERPADLEYQRNLGIALYRYASMKKDVPLLNESIRLLKRVLATDNSNFDMNVVMGNAYFDIGYFGQDSASYSTARQYYETALTKKPDDASVRTDYGLTYFLQMPPDNEKAIAEFDRALRSDPKNEKALEFSTQVHLKRNDAPNARRTLEQLKSANPGNPSIPGLTSEVSGISGPPK